jgi:chemotaxis protein methyltransferase CheR
VFGRWSFRDAPDWLKHQSFRPTDDGQFEILPAIREMVHFVPLNLVQDAYPSMGAANAMDIIFCRNVLMYFSPEQTGRVIEKLHAAQTDGGYLIIGPGELTMPCSSSYAAVNLNGTTIYRRAEEPHAVAIPAPMLSCEMLATAVPPRSPATKADSTPASDAISPAELQRQARKLANEGNLADALDYCDRSIAADGLNSSAHYLRAVILQEQGDIERATGSLRSALFVDPNFVPAHLALAGIARKRSKPAEAARHLKNAKKLLRRYPPMELLPEFEGVSAARLLQLTDSLIDREVAA